MAIAARFSVFFLGAGGPLGGATSETAASGPGQSETRTSSGMDRTKSPTKTWATNAVQHVSHVPEALLLVRVSEVSHSQGGHLELRVYELGVPKPETLGALVSLRGLFKVS